MDVLSLQPLIKVGPDILSALACHGIDANDAVAFFVETFEKVRTLPANYRYRKVKRDNVWIVRDNYPDTNIFYKMTVVYNNEEQLMKTMGYPKGTAPGGMLILNVKLLPPKHKYRINVSYEAVQKYLIERTNCILVGDGEKPKPYLSVDVKVPRRMYPKGFKEV